jgi:hypothetical protein
MNALMVLHPYKHEGQWVFDDPTVGLDKEPFVAGTDDIIDQATQIIPNAEKGFTLIFAATSFPGHNLALEWQREEYGGNWYYSPELDMEGWLCPALFKYFDSAPKRIYAQFKGQ